MVSNEKGQSAIEFILTFAFALGMTFLFINQAINMTSGYLVHYVNFMSSRAFLVRDNGIASEATIFNDARAHALRVMESYDVSKVGINANTRVIIPSETNGLFTGTVMSFEKKLSSMPMVGGGKSARFYSESFLGKEPSRITCSKMICAAILGNADRCSSEHLGLDMVLYDNGC